MWVFLYVFIAFLVHNFVFSTKVREMVIVKYALDMILEMGEDPRLLSEEDKVTYLSLSRKKMGRMFFWKSLVWPLTLMSIFGYIIRITKTQGN